MNNPSPLVPQGSNLEQKNKGGTSVRNAVFFIISIHVVGLMSLLMWGCRKQGDVAENNAPDTNMVAPPMLEATNPIVAATVDTNPVVVAPPMAENAPPSVAPGAQDYTVVRNDNFTTIGRKFGVTAKAIQDANPTIDPKTLQIGTKLHIPAPTTPTTTTTPNAPTTSGGESVYTVKSGDNLTTIATHFGTSVKAIRSVNTLTNDKIYVGQKLKIPAKTPAPTPASPTT